MFIDWLTDLYRRRLIRKWRQDCAAIGIHEHLYSDDELVHVEHIARRPAGVRHMSTVLVPLAFGQKMRRLPWLIHLAVRAEGWMRANTVG